MDLCTRRALYFWSMHSLGSVLVYKQWRCQIEPIHGNLPYAASGTKNQTDICFTFRWQIYYFSDFHLICLCFETCFSLAGIPLPLSTCTCWTIDLAIDTSKKVLSLQSNDFTVFVIFVEMSVRSPSLVFPGPKSDGEFASGFGLGRVGSGRVGSDRDSALRRRPVFCSNP